MGYPLPTETTDPRGYKPSGAWTDWRQYINDLTLNPADFPFLRSQAETGGQLRYNPQYRNLQRMRSNLGRQYTWGKREIEPEYRRNIAEQRYGLGSLLNQNQLAQEQTGQDYDISAHNLAKTYGDARRRAEADMSRRGLFQSGALSKQNTMLGNQYIQGTGDLERARSTRLSDLTRQGMVAQERGQFNLSDAQRARTDQLRKLLEVYQGQMSDADWQQQALTEEQGQRSSYDYQNLMDSYRNFGLQARQQSLNESKYHSDSLWKQRTFDEEVRQYELERQMKIAAMQRSYGGGYRGHRGHRDEEEEPAPTSMPFDPEYIKELQSTARSKGKHGWIWMLNQIARQL
jgi:hypothetical protein